MPHRSLEEINAELETARWKLSLLFAQIESLESLKKKVCEHKNTEYWKDPSGNNGGGYECKDCGKDL